MPIYVNVPIYFSKNSVRLCLWQIQKKDNLVSYYINLIKLQAVVDPGISTPGGVVEFLRSEVCFDAPFTHTLHFRG